MRERRGETTMVTASVSDRRKPLRAQDKPLALTSVVDDGRELKAETLAERGGSLDEDIVSVESRHDDVSLMRAIHARRQLMTCEW